MSSLSFTQRTKCRCHSLYVFGSINWWLGLLDDRGRLSNVLQQWFLSFSSKLLPRQQNLPPLWATETACCFCYRSFQQFWPPDWRSIASTSRSSITLSHLRYLPWSSNSRCFTATIFRSYSGILIIHGYYQRVVWIWQRLARATPPLTHCFENFRSNCLHLSKISRRKPGDVVTEP